jgi:hypothetical protein
VDFDADGKFTYKSISSGKVIKEKTFDNIEDCLNDLCFYCFTKISALNFSVKKPLLNKAFEELDKDNAEPFANILNSNMDYLLYVVKIPLIWNMIVDKNGSEKIDIEKVYNYICNKGDYSLVNILKRNPIIWYKLKEIDKDNNLEDGSSMGEMGFGD